MYDQNESSLSKSTLIDRLCSSDKKVELKRTNHASTNKRGSPSLKKFYEFKEELIEEQSQVEKYQVKSPRISNFTIEEAALENEEHSEMLDSLHVQQPVKNVNFNSSIG
jgi:anion-transporting  ArsA/GET3 family ATPase